MATKSNRRNVDPIEVGIVLLIVGIIVVVVLATVSGGGGGKTAHQGGSGGSADQSGGEGRTADQGDGAEGRTADAGELRACLGREAGVESHVYGFPGEPSEVLKSFALTDAPVEVFVMKNSGAAESAASHALQRRPRGLVSDVAHATSSENVMWMTLGPKTADTRIRACIREAS